MPFYTSRAIALLAIALSVLSRSVVAQEDAEHSGDLFSGLPLLVQLVLLVLLLGLSSVFCGLTLGVMGLDTLYLEIIADSGKEPDRSCAREILPVRRLGHQSLSTLVLGNMLCNVLIAQLIQDLTPPGDSAEIISFAVATLFILIFAEVIPMSVCRGPRALEIAAAGVPILRAFLVLLYPIAKPLGIVLDLLTPHDVGQIYDRNELKKLMRIHCEAHGDKSGLDITELKMLIGAMEFHEQVVGHVMTPLTDVFMLSSTTPVSQSLVEMLWKAGKSRVPIFQDDNRKNITGVLFVKDLVSMLAYRSGHVSHELQDYGGLTVGQLMNSNSRDLVRVKFSTTLPNVLRVFQSGVSTHLLLVEEDAETNGASYGRFVGIVTLEDVIERLIKSEIRDEYDDEVTSDDDVLLLEDDRSGTSGGHATTSDVEGEQSGVSRKTGATTFVVPTPSNPVDSSVGFATTSFTGSPAAAAARRKLQKLPARMPRVNFSSFYVTGRPLADEQRWVLADYLQRTVPAFVCWKVTHVKLLLDEVGDREFQVGNDDVPDDLTRDGSLVDPTTMASADVGADTDGVDVAIMRPSASTIVAPPRRAPPSIVRGAAGHRALAARLRRDLVLYRYEEPSSVFTLLLHGGVRVVVGDDMFNHECRSFTTFGESALMSPFDAAAPHSNTSFAVGASSSKVETPTCTASGQALFVPDFTAVVSRKSRIISISLKDVCRVQSYFHSHQRSKHHDATPVTTRHVRVQRTPSHHDTMMHEERRAQDE